MCYHGGPAGTVYEGLGQCEVVQVALDAEAAAAEFTALLESFFSSFVRTDGGMQRPDPQVPYRYMALHPKLNPKPETKL